MRKLTITPDGDYDEITVAQVDTYRRRVGEEGSIVIEIQQRKGESWEDVETANKHQERKCRIILDKSSITTLSAAITNASEEAEK